MLSGYVFSTARDAATQTDGLQRGYFEPGEAAEAFGRLLAQVADPGRFPALLGAVTGGAFAATNPFPDFDLGLRVVLDGVDALIVRAGADG